MFFVLSKILSFVIQPLVWLVFVLIWARLTRNERRRQWLLSIALLIVVAGTQPLLINAAYGLWEVPPVAMDSLGEGGQADGFEVAIVLGGFGSAERELKDRFNFNASANRLTQALELYHQGIVRKILVTGGSAVIIGEKLNEGEAVERLLRRIGFPAEDLLIESRSRNTHENAVFTATLLREQGIPGSRCLLLTDGFHMRRALGCFETVGVRATAFSTSQSDHPFGSASPAKWLLPDGGGFAKWARLLKELVGSVVYRVSGKG